jgi:hypothetical protein
MAKGKDITDLGRAVTLIEQLVNKMGGTLSPHFSGSSAVPQFRNYLEIKLSVGFDPAALRKFLGKKTASDEAKEGKTDDGN